MLEVTAVPAKLMLKTPFHIAHGSSPYRENVFLQIKTDKKTAYGEAAVVPYYGVTKEQILEDLKRTITPEMIQENQTLEVVDSFSYTMSACAYTTAMLGLQEKNHSQTKRDYTRGSSFTIAYTSDMQRMMDAIASCGFSTIKLKAGFPDDVQRIKLIRERFPDIHIRLDANQGWSFKEACSIITQLEDLSIELIEEPIAGSADQLRTLSSLSDIPIILDETVQTIDDLERYADSIAGIVVKLAKSGGPQAAKRLIQAAEKHTLDVLLSCMVESSLAVTSALSLEPLCRWIDLDGPLLLAEDPFTGLTYRNELPVGSLQELTPSPKLRELFSSTPPFIMES
ncbi:MAG: L-Ala-D/L-Glu epimerase [Sphaerochaeta sp.]|nr:L-Ala-D/L-Glu epimerase [Sphaerochaeta sp.]